MMFTSEDVVAFCLIGFVQNSNPIGGYGNNWMVQVTPPHPVDSSIVVNDQSFWVKRENIQTV